MFRVFTEGCYTRLLFGLKGFKVSHPGGIHISLCKRGSKGERCACLPTKLPQATSLAFMCDTGSSTESAARFFVPVPDLSMRSPEHTSWLVGIEAMQHTFAHVE